MPAGRYVEPEHEVTDEYERAGDRLTRPHPDWPVDAAARISDLRLGLIRLARANPAALVAGLRFAHRPCNSMMNTP